VTTGGQRNVITYTEIQMANNPMSNAWDFIAYSRPHMLRDRGPTSIQNTNPPTATVFLDEAELGGIQVLKTINMGSVREIRYLSAADATTRYGMGHTGGVIVIKTH
jgi:hypothetical protein